MIRLIAALALMLPTVATACTVPVFRYALDRWPPDAFRLEAPAAALRGEPIASDLRGDEGVRLNIEALPLEQEQNARLLFPAQSGEAAAVWSGELNAANYRAIVASPARGEIAKRLLAGETAVWVLVESGSPAASEMLAKRLGEQIAAIENTATLPVIRPDDPSSQVGPGPKLQVKFSLLRIPRAAAEEQAFIAMLAGPDGIAALPATEAFAALVFGRGHVAGAWSAEKLTGELVEKASLFLIGACSCEAKHLNPGWDTLMRVNWDAELEKVAQARIAAGEAPAEPAASVRVETVTIRPKSTPPQVPNVRDTTAVLGGVAVLVAATALLFWMRARRH